MMDYVVMKGWRRHHSLMTAPHCLATRHTNMSAIQQPASSHQTQGTQENVKRTQTLAPRGSDDFEGSLKETSEERDIKRLTISTEIVSLCFPLNKMLATPSVNNTINIRPAARS